jgi:uncharacterized protein with LGFP repeats
MTGLRTRLGTTIGRACVGVIAVLAAALLVAPVAVAAPADDADAAITQAWDAGGGATGPLGDKDGGVYPVGAGFGQNFAAGKIFFTPETGAHAMQGAILDKYESLGGPADGDLGFPTIDEGDGKAPGSRNTTFSAADRPVIFWTPDAGAIVVRGALNAAWDKLGGSAGILGVPTEDEVYRGDDVSQTFSGGQVTWNRKTNAFTTTPPELADQLAGLAVPGDVTTAIAAARRAAGGPLGPLGAEDGGQYKIGDDGTGQNFAGGKIFYSPATGANVLTGQVLAKYESVGGPGGDLGFPTSNENDGGVAPMSMIATFAAADQPVIFWTPDYGAVIVRGAMNAAWAKLGGATGQLGAPTADETQNGDIISQKFSGGAISWNKKTNAFTTEPAGLASQLSGLEVPGGAASQAPPAAAGTSGDAGSKSFRPSVWWLLGIVPVLVLIGAVAAAVVFNRRRRETRGPFVDDEHDEYDGYDDHRDDDRDDDHDDDHDHDHEDDHRDDDGYESQTEALGAVDEGGGRRSSWAMPAGQHGDAAPASESEGFAADLTENQDAIDTAPTPITVAVDDDPDDDRHPWLAGLDATGGDEMPEERSGEEDADVNGVEDEVGGHGPQVPEMPEPDSGPPSGRHAAIQLDEPVTAETSLRLASDDPFVPPDGYPIKADTKSGLYWTPASSHYDLVRAELWFASEEFALTNGFTKG